MMLMMLHLFVDWTKLRAGSQLSS